MTRRKAKGIGLLSGGLDSILAVRVLKEQELDLVGVIFTTPFFGPKPGQDLSHMIGIPLQVIDITDQHLEMLKNPRYGYGSNMNPCIDCHALMLRVAGRLMEQEEADFLFTGEVLGQRPMSQRRDSMRSVEKLSGYAGRVLRPLSAKLLSPTLVEQEGLVDRERLMDIQGRSRRPQMELAERYGITGYPQPGGGCMLTKEGFSKKLRQLFLLYPQAGAREIELIKWGRHFRLPEGSLCAVGRHQSDNQRLEALASWEDTMLRVITHPSPTGVLLASPGAEADLSLAARIVASYCDAPPGVPVSLECRHRGLCRVIQEKRGDKAEFAGLMV